MSKRKSKRTAPPEASAPADLVAVKVMREQEWAYAAWLAHVPFAQMRVEVAKPPSEGGLGYELSVQALRGLVTGYRARVGDLSATREEQIERELHDLDAIQRAAGLSLARAEAAEALDVHAAKLYLDAGAQRRKLLGLDAAVKVEAEVTHRDAVAEELNAMLGRAGRDPIGTDAP
jgi:hypothetical protein